MGLSHLGIKSNYRETRRIAYLKARLISDEYCVEGCVGMRPTSLKPFLWLPFFLVRDDIDFADGWVVRDFPQEIGIESLSKGEPPVKLVDLPAFVAESLKH